MKVPDMPAPVKKPAPVTPESAEVKAAGEAELNRSRTNQGRRSLFSADPRKTGFAGLFPDKTGSA